MMWSAVASPSRAPDIVTTMRALVSLVPPSSPRYVSSSNAFTVTVPFAWVLMPVPSPQLCASHTYPDHAVPHDEREHGHIAGDGEQLVVYPDPGGYRAHHEQAEARARRDPEQRYGDADQHTGHAGEFEQPDGAPQRHRHAEPVPVAQRVRQPEDLDAARGQEHQGDHSGQYPEETQAAERSGERPPVGGPSWCGWLSAGRGRAPSPPGAPRAVPSAGGGRRGARWPAPRTGGGSSRGRWAC